MDKAKLEITKTIKGEFVANIIFPNGKKQPAPDLKLKDNTLNGKEVGVLREKGQVVKTICESKEKKSKSKKPFSKQAFSPTFKPDDIYSRAPYNFIPLNKKVVPAEEIPDFDKYHKDRYTGYIEIEIKTLTPLYIRDTLTEEEYREKVNSKEKGQQYTNPNFFSPGDLLRIPGSSIRGMIRTMVEIMSFGKFWFFEDARLYYRGLADKCINLREEYSRKIGNKSAGILYKRGFEYFIKPAKGFKHISKDEACKKIENNGYTYKEFEHYKVENGYIVVSGEMKGKKRDWFIEFPDENVEEIKVPDKDIQNYKNDKNRSKSVPDLLKLAKDGVPCFYVKYKDTEGNERIAFGHTGFFRLPYEKTIGDHISSELKNPNLIDIAEAIFGNERTHASRIFFEDAYLEGNPEDALLEPNTPKILSNPKPTCFQHYLEQKLKNLEDHPKNLAHYNLDNPIRGHKLYWHRSGENWIEENKENIRKHPTQYTCITPVRPNSVFKGRIRFENLSKVELGALLFALDLPKCCAHKLGMGKPLGLGSVRITPNLYLSDRNKRYSDLFAEWDRLEEKSNEISEFKKAFEKYVLDKLGESNKSSLWEIDRMKELKTMLDFNNKPPDDKTDYLPLQEFKKRKVLPKPSEIIELYNTQEE